MVRQHGPFSVNLIVVEKGLNACPGRLLDGITVRLRWIRGTVGGLGSVRLWKRIAMLQGNRDRN